MSKTPGVLLAMFLLSRIPAAAQYGGGPPPPTQYNGGWKIRMSYSGTITTQTVFP